MIAQYLEISKFIVKIERPSFEIFSRTFEWEPIQWFLVAAPLKNAEMEIVVCANFYLAEKPVFDEIQTVYLQSGPEEQAVILANLFGIEALRLQDCYLEFKSDKIVLIDFYHHTTHLLFAKNKSNELTKILLAPADLGAHFLSWNSALIHSSAVLRSQKVAMFLADDGGGKTTTATSGLQGDILCDDQVLVYRIGDQAVACPTPWGRYINRQLSGPIGAFFLIEKANQFKLFPVSSRDVIQFIMQESAAYFKILPHEYRERAFNTVCEIARAAQAYRMQVPLGGVDWNAIDVCLE